MPTLILIINVAFYFACYIIEFEVIKAMEHIEKQNVYREKYNEWLKAKWLDDETRNELNLICEDDFEIRERFLYDLEFGTGGLRGIIGAGSNRINKYTIRKATQGLANYINKTGQGSVAIAYDSRLYSKEFAQDTALVLNANGISTYIFDRLHPTPTLSFAVRQLKCKAGIVITASHNPKEYNGYKVYWSDGAQIVSPIDKEIIEAVNAVSFSDIKICDKQSAIESGLYNVIDESVDDKYIAAVKTQSLHQNASNDLKIIYTPLNGSGNELVRRVLRECNFDVAIVPEQELPDGTFPTLNVPNPESPQSFDLALQLANSIDADVIIGTDPDCDRIGVVVKHVGEYKFLTGNMTGILLTNYILSQSNDLTNGLIISTIVSTKLTKLIAKKYGVQYAEVLTGFKYICEKIRLTDKRFIFGFEESYGYLSGTYARDKDAVVAAMLICEMTQYYKNQNMTLIDALDSIYEEFGYHRECLESIELKGVDGLIGIRKIMSDLREAPPHEINDIKVVNVKDYSKNDYDLPKSDVLMFELEDGSWICIRPSGTEPKIKIYFGICETEPLRLNSKLDKLIKSSLSLVLRSRAL